MGRRGPLKGSRHFGVVKGGKSPPASQEPPKAAGKRLSTPRWLPPEGRRILRKIVTELQALGIYKESDQAGLYALALHFAIMAMAADQLRDENGKPVITVPDPDHPVADPEATGDSDSPATRKPAVRKHPLLSVIAHHSEKLRAWSMEFSLTPVARERLNIKPPKGANRLAKFLNQS